MMIYLYSEQSLSDCCSDVELCCEGAAEMIPGQDKQAKLANMTPLWRERNFHRGLSNQIYLLCLNSSGAYSAIQQFILLLISVEILLDE